MTTIDAAKIIRDDSSNPIRSQLRDILLQEIHAGKFVRGKRFESERELALRFQISRSSVREALADLINARVLVRGSSRNTVLAEGMIRTAARQIAFIISDDIFRFVQTGYDRILKGVEEVCRRNGDTLVFQSITDRLGQPNLPGSERPNGYLIVGGIRRVVLEQLRKSAIPLVLVDLLVHGNMDEIESVKIDYPGGTVLAIEHLYGLGHKHIGFIGFASSDKYEAYWKALSERKLTYNPAQVEFLHPVDLEPGILTGFEAMQRMIKRADLPTAVLATNDCVARGAIEALAIAGMRVPTDISIVGYDDLPISTAPRLTTVQVDLERVGQLAMEALDRRISDPATEAANTFVPVTLIARRSSGVAPSGL